MQISKRLEAVADMVTPGCNLADIGTDHAYIPIYLAQQGKISRALAMDVNKGPLERAKEHICSYKLDHMIETRLSDGLFALQPGEADHIVIAGMGGPLTARILRDGAGKITGDCALILQPQSEIQTVRAYLRTIGYRIVREEMIVEDGKYYPMMKAVPADQSDEYQEEDRMMYAAQLRYGPLLIRRRHPVLLEYLYREQLKNKKILSSLEGQESDTASERRTAVEAELEMIEKVLALYKTE